MPTPPSTPIRTHLRVKTPGAPKKKKRAPSVRRRFVFPDGVVEGDMSELEI
jgi:hypothetical protein